MLSWFYCGADLTSVRPAKQMVQNISTYIKKPWKLVHRLTAIDVQGLYNQSFTSDILKYDIFSSSNCSCKL